MFNNQKNMSRSQPYSAGSVAYDEGLRSHFGKVYNTMSIGLVVTGLTAYMVSGIPAVMQTLFTTPLVYLVMFAPMLFLMFGFTHDRIMTKSAGQLRTLFYAFCAVFGVSMSAIFLAFTGADIARAFFVTAGAFAATSAYGYTTKADLSKMTSFLFMGTIGLLIAIVVNLFLKSPMIHFLISGAGVVIYTLWTAFHTQSIKESYDVSYGEESNSKSAVLGALNLYVDFMMMFQFILSLMSNRE